MVKHNLGVQGTLEAWLNRSQDWAQNTTNGNLFFEGPTLYSYGKHFPLATHLEGDDAYLLNADRYSVTTAKHQTWVQSLVRHKYHALVPFTALAVAGIPAERPTWDSPGLTIQDIEEDRTIPVERKSYHFDEVLRKYIPYTIPMRDMHLMGRSVISWDHNYYLSGLDETATDIWRSFFLSQLPEPCNTVNDAIESLKPREITDDNFVRQGEWFCVPCPELNTRNLINEEKHAFLVSSNPSRRKSHIATNLRYDKEGNRYIRGTLRHTVGEHRMLKLGNIWHRVYENRAVNSWSALGRID